MEITVATHLPVALMALLAVPTTVGAVNPITIAVTTNLVVAAPLDRLARLGVIPAPVLELAEVAPVAAVLVVVVLAEVVAAARPSRLRLLLPLHPL